MRNLAILAVLAVWLGPPSPADAQSTLNIGGADVPLNGNVVLFAQPPRDTTGTAQVQSILVPKGGSWVENVLVTPDANAPGGYATIGVQDVSTQNLCITQRADIFGPSGKAQWGQLAQGCDLANAGSGQPLGWTDLSTQSFGANAPLVQ
jgi:hypothetical protein